MQGVDVEMVCSWVVSKDHQGQNEEEMFMGLSERIDRGIQSDGNRVHETSRARRSLAMK